MGTKASQVVFLHRFLPLRPTVDFFSSSETLPKLEDSDLTKENSDLIFPILEFAVFYALDIFEIGAFIDFGLITLFDFLFSILGAFIDFCFLLGSIIYD